MIARKCNCAFWLLSTLVAIVLAFPVLYYGWHGVSMVGLFEESIAYRYFYVMRMVYGGEHPWVASAHLPGLLWIGTQYALTWAGFPPTQLFPRIDVFYYTATLYPHLLSVFAFAFAARNIESWGARALLAVGAWAVVYNTRVTFWPGAWPEYVPWAVPVALLAIGIVGRVVSASAEGRPTVSIANALILGIFAAACAGVKPSYASFPVAVGAAMVLADGRWLRGLIFLAASMALAISAYAAIVYAYHLGNWEAFRTYWMLQVQWLTTMSGTVTDAPRTQYEWARTFMPRGMHDVLPWIFLLPVFALVLGAFGNRFRIAYAVVAGAVLSLYTLITRFYDLTMVEVAAFAYFGYASLVLVLARGVGTAILRVRGIGLSATIGREFLAVCLAASMIWIGWPPLKARYDTVYRSSLGLSAPGQALWNEVLTNGHHTTFLTQDDNFRPHFVGSAICKGGTDPFEPRWGISPYMTAMFPNIYCAMYYRNVPNPEKLDQVLFKRYRDEPHDRAIRRNEAHFQISLDTHDCSREFEFPGTFIIVCARLFDGAPTATRAPSRAVVVRWTPDLPMERYEIEAARQDGQFFAVGSVSGAESAANIDNRDLDSLKFVRVIGVRGGVRIGASLAALIDIVPEALFQGASTFSARALEPTGIQLRWEFSGVNPEIAIEAATGSEKFKVAARPPSGIRSWTFGHLGAGQRYRFRMRSCIESGCVWSPEVTVGDSAGAAR